MRRTPNGEHPFGCACGGDLPHDQQGLAGDWCPYWTIFWYGVGTEILRQKPQNFCSTFDVGKPGYK